MSGDQSVFRTPEDWAGEEAGRHRDALRWRRHAVRDYRDVFHGEAGGRVLDDLIARFAGESYCRGDPHHTAYREGQRSVIEHIARTLAHGRSEPQQSNEDESDD